MKSQDLMFHSVGERMHQRTRGASTAAGASYRIDPEFFQRIPARRSPDRKSIPPPVGQSLAGPTG